MPGSNNFNGNPNHFPGRVERLVRERELRKSSRSEKIITEVSEYNQRFREDNNNSGASHAQYPEGTAKGLSEGSERPDGRPYRQRLLVVANRLPVSAIRRGEDSWSLEISAGGLVTALLGNVIVGLTNSAPNASV